MSSSPVSIRPAIVLARPTSYPEKRLLESDCSAPLSSLDRFSRVFVTLSHGPHSSFVSLVLTSSIDHCTPFHCSPRACFTFLEQGLVLLIWFQILIEPVLAFCLRNVDSVHGSLLRINVLDWSMSDR